MGIALCYFIIYISEAFIIWFYASNIFISKYSKIAEAFLLFFFYALQLVLLLVFQHSWVNGISFFMGNLFFFLTCYQIKWYSALFHSAMATTIMSLCELIFYSILPHLELSLSTDSSHLRILVLYTVLNKTFYFFIIYIISYIFKWKNKSGQQRDRFALLLAAVPCASLLMILTLFIVCEGLPLPAGINWLTAISSFLMLAVNLLIFSINSHNQRKNEEFTRLQILLQNESNYREYHKLLLNEQENQSMLIHDIRHHLQVISGLNYMQNKKIDRYIENLMGTPGLDSTAKICGHELLNIILCRYQKLCHDRDIAFSADIRNNAASFISDNDLTILFGNLLDNACDAASGIKNSFVDIKIQNRKHTPFTLVSVQNSCLTDPFSTIDHKLHTSKPDKMRHGYGVHSIERMVQKYNGEIQMYFNSEYHTFHTVLMLRQTTSERRVS